jgi:hypothetical protein
MGYSFKSIANKNITKHTAHKKYELAISNSTGSFDGLNVFAYQGSSNSLEWDTANNTLTTNGYAKRDIYYSIQSDFYKSCFSGAFTGLLSQDPTGSNINKSALPSSINIISIPHLMKGDSLKPGSIVITSGSLTLSDDAYGNLISGSTNVGNVFYDYGVVVLNVSASTDWSNAFSYCNLEFKNTYKMEEHEYMCNVGKEEFNASTNQSILSDIQTKTLKSFTSSSTWNPYITTVGLYDQDNELLAIGKLGQAIKKSEKYDTSFIIRFDT